MGKWGPDGRVAAASIAFDNLGEASLLEGGRLPEDAKIGSDPSVTVALPQLLEVLKERDTKSTFFVEAWNVDVYPDALRAIVDAGHEIGCHGFRHEAWYELSEEKQTELLTKATEAYATLGISVEGFRPPAGVLTSHSAELLPSLGYSYGSPLGTTIASERNGLAILPVTLSATDAVYYMPVPGLAEYRLPPGGPEIAEADALVEGFMLTLEDAIAGQGFMSATFHMTFPISPDRLRAVGEVAERLRSNDRVWLAPCREVADWVRVHSKAFPSPRIQELTELARTLEGNLRRLGTDDVDLYRLPSPDS